ncbi:hypothetical protein Tco_0084344 [Tanacetum coccineum]
MVKRDDEIKEKVSQEEALEKFNSMVERDDEIKVLGEINVELESGTNKLIEKLSQEKDNDDASISGKSSEHFGWDCPEKDSPCIEVAGDVVFYLPVHEEVAEEVTEMVNDQAEALSDQEVADDCLNDKQVEERRPSKRIRVTQEEMFKDEKPKKADKDPLVSLVFGS